MISLQILFISGVAMGGKVGASAPGRQGLGAPKWGLKSLINFIFYFDATFLCDLKQTSYRNVWDLIMKS